MSEFHCLDIEFPDVDFSPCFDSSNTEVANSFHAHLYVCKDEIELKVFYEEDIYRCFVEKLDAWTNKIVGKNSVLSSKLRLLKITPTNASKKLIYPKRNCLISIMELTITKTTRNMSF